MIIRRAEITDIQPAWELAREFILGFYTKEPLRCKEIELRKGLVQFLRWSYVAEEETQEKGEVKKEIVGILAGVKTEMFITYQPTWAEALFYIREDKRKGVIGYRMVKFLEEDLKTRGIEVVTLGLAPASIQTRGMYKRMGYNFLTGHYAKGL